MWRRTVCARRVSHPVASAAGGLSAHGFVESKLRSPGLWAHSLQNNMASGGLLDADEDESVSKSTRSRPSYDGSRGAWPSFAILSKAYLRKKGVESIIVDGTMPTMRAVRGARARIGGGPGQTAPSAPSERYWVMCRDGTSGPGQYTGSEMFAAVAAGILDAENPELLAQRVNSPADEWVTLQTLLNSLIQSAQVQATQVQATPAARNLFATPSGALPTPADELTLREQLVTLFDEVMSMISDKTQTGKSLLLTIDSKFPAGRRDAHALWTFLEARYERSVQGGDGKQVVAQIKLLKSKFVYGMTPDTFEATSDEFNRLWELLPQGLRGVDGDFFRHSEHGMFALLPKKPFDPWIKSYVDADDMRDSSDNSWFADAEEFNNRLATRYQRWYTDQGGDGETVIKLPVPAAHFTGKGGRGKGGGRGGGRGRGRGGCCVRCWTPLHSEGGHRLSECPRDPKTCDACGADGSVLSCGGEYNASKCMVAHECPEFTSLPDFLKRPIQDKRDALAAEASSSKIGKLEKGLKKALIANKAKTKAAALSAASDDEEASSSSDAEAGEPPSSAASSSSRNRRPGRSAGQLTSLRLSHPLIARGGFMCRLREHAALVAPALVAPRTFDDAIRLHAQLLDADDDATPISMAIDSACKPRSAVNDLRLLLPGSLVPMPPDSTMMCGGGDVPIVCEGTLSRFAYTSDGGLVNIRQERVAYVPDLPVNLCSTGSLWTDNEMELREPILMLVRSRDDLRLPVRADCIGMPFLETYGAAVCLMHVALQAQGHLNRNACPMINLLINVDPALPSPHLVAFSASRKGTEKQVRDYLLWHARLGCLHPTAMALTAIHALGHSIPLNAVRIAGTQLTMCDSCCRGKMVSAPKLGRGPRLTSADLETVTKVKLSPPHEIVTLVKTSELLVELPDTRATSSKRVGQFITFDTWGPFKTQAHGSKSRYAHGADDAFSGLLLLYGSARKTSEVHKKIDAALRVDLISYGADVKQPIEIKHTDGAYEFDNADYIDFLALKLTQWQGINPYDSAQLGRIERKWRTLGEPARAMLLRGNAPLDAWLDAMHYAAAINNVITRVRRVRYSVCSPHERALGSVPDLRNFHVFWAPCYALIHATMRQSKMSEVSTLGNYIGHAANHAGALVRLHDGRRITVSFNHLKVDDKSLAFQTPRLLPAVTADDIDDHDNAPDVVIANANRPAQGGTPVIQPAATLATDSTATLGADRSTRSSKVVTYVQPLRNSPDFALRDAPDPPQHKLTLGDRVRVYWTLEDKWYPGKVVIHPTEGVHSRVHRYKTVNKPPERQLCVAYDIPGYEPTWHDVATTKIEMLKQALPCAALLANLEDVLQGTVRDAAGLEWIECSPTDTGAYALLGLMHQTVSVSYQPQAVTVDGHMAMAMSAGRAAVVGDKSMKSGAKVGDSVEGVSEPTSLPLALTLPEAEEWWREAQIEHRQVENARLALVPLSSLPAGARVLKAKWVFKIKSNDQRLITRFKVRGVGRGDGQQKGRDYHNGFHPVARSCTWKLIVAKSVSRGWILERRDLPGFYLQAKLTDANSEFVNNHSHIRLFMEQFAGFEELGPEGETMVNEMDGSLYGFVQAGRAAGRKLSKDFEGHHKFRRLTSDRCAYSRTEGDEEINLAVIVDDMIVGTNSPRMLAELDKKLNESWGQVFGPITGGPLADSGCLNKKFTYDPALRMGAITSPKYFIELELTYMTATAAQLVSKFEAHVPSDERIMKLDANNMRFPMNRAERDQVKEVRSLVMAINYAAIEFRPDVSFWASTYARFMEYYDDTLRELVLQTLKYLIKTQHMGIAYSSGSDDITGGESRPDAWMDSSWVVHEKDSKKKSMSGRVYRYANGPLMWSSKSQRNQGGSSAAVELNALVEGLGDALFLRELAYEYDIPQEKPLCLHTDNAAAVFIGEDAAAAKKSKSDARHAILLQEAVEAGLVRMQHWPGNNNVADILTKWLPRNTFQRYRSVLLNLRAQRKLGLPVD